VSFLSSQPAVYVTNISSRRLQLLSVGTLVSFLASQPIVWYRIIMFRIAFVERVKPMICWIYTGNVHYLIIMH